MMTHDAIKAIKRNQQLLREVIAFIDKCESGGHVLSIIEHRFEHDGKDAWADGFGFRDDCENAIDCADRAIAHLARTA